MLSRLVIATALVAKGVYATGQHEAIFHAENLPGGLYLARIESGGRTESQRSTLRM